LGHLVGQVRELLSDVGTSQQPPKFSDGLGASDERKRPRAGVGEARSARASGIGHGLKKHDRVKDDLAAHECFSSHMACRSCSTKASRSSSVMPLLLKSAAIGAIFSVNDGGEPLSCSWRKST